MVVEDMRQRARRELEGMGLSMESASYLVDDRPPGGWDSLVTHDHLRAELAELRTELHDGLAAVQVQMSSLASGLRGEMRDQTRWLTGALLVGMGLIAAILRVA
jgi:hypothetical protein